MDNITALLLAAIASLAAAVIALWRDNRALAKQLATQEAAHATKIEGSLKDAAEKFAGVIETVTSSHQKQEDVLHTTHRDQVTVLVKEYTSKMDALVREQKVETQGLVDRVIAGVHNDKDHDDEVMNRVLDLAEALKRLAESSKTPRPS